VEFYGSETRSASVVVLRLARLLPLHQHRLFAHLVRLHKPHKTHLVEHLVHPLHQCRLPAPLALRIKGLGFVSVWDELSLSLLWNEVLEYSQFAVSFKKVGDCSEIEVVWSWAA
jgi:hypothetical protein